MKNPARRMPANGVVEAGSGLLAFGFDFSEHFDPHWGHAAVDETESLGGTDGDVDDAAAGCRDRGR